MSAASVAPPRRLLPEAVTVSGPRRSTPQSDLRALALGVASLISAAQRLDRESTSHVWCPGCPICGVRAALDGLGLRAEEVRHA